MPWLPHLSISTAERTIASGKLTRPILLALAIACAAAGQSSADRARALVQRMTLEEKLSLVHGARDPKDLGQAGYWPGSPRLGIPPLRFADGPPGINVNREATALPAPVGLAATFDVEAARLYGVVLGRDAAALEQNVVLAPHINIVRDPSFRRNHTALSEDPLLTAELAAAEIRGIQSEGVMAAVKHLAVYNGSPSVVVDERTLHEIYLPAFEAAVRAGVAAVMCAYNQVNGHWACENGELQNHVLRDELGFRGFVVSDWAAVHSPQAITQGLDLEMPGREIAGRRGGPYFTDALKTAVESGTIPVAAIDRALERLLEQMIRFGLLDRKSSGPRPINIEADARIARRIAAEGAVLLKNDARVLPLRAEDLGSLVLIGPTAGQLATGFLGERAYGFESRLVSPRSALGHNISYSRGVDLTGTTITTDGLLRRREGIGDTETRVDRNLDFDDLEPGADYSWSGTLIAPTEGDYTFMVQPALDHGSEGGGSISIDGRRVARSGGPGFIGSGMVAKKWSGIVPTTDGRDNGRGGLHLTGGPHRIELTANSTGEGRLRIRFAWITPEFRRAAIASAVAAARTARTAVVFAWSDSGVMELPEAQDEMISEIAAVAPRTIVVLNTGGPVQMPWKDRVAAILEMWYPGQEGGWATTDILLGRVNPGGRLPVGFPRDHFPFGYGLSYTRFEYSNLKPAPGRGGLDVTFTLRNTGKTRGAEVCQAYLAKLAAFQRVELEPGESRTVTMRIDKRQLSYWSVDRHAWVLEDGARTVRVGPLSYTALPQ